MFLSRPLFLLALIVSAVAVCAAVLPGANGRSGSKDLALKYVQSKVGRPSYNGTSAVASPDRVNRIRPAATAVRAVNAQVIGANIHVVINADSPAQYEDFTLSNPPRIVVDVAAAHNAGGNMNVPLVAGEVERVRVGQPSPNVVRVVLDCKANVPYSISRSGASLVVTVSNSPIFAKGHERARVDSGAPAAQSLCQLRGTVADETGALIVGAMVTLDDGYGHHYFAKSDDMGTYTLTGIIPGVYKLAAVAKGFPTFTDSVDFTSLRAVTLNIKIKLFFTEKMEVKADKQALATVLSGKSLESLPSDPQRLSRVLRQMAGAGEGDVTIYVDGFLRDGQIPPKEAIQMIRINSHPFAAEFSEPGFNRIEIVTKPASDSFHAEAGFDFNDASFNARNAFAPSRAASQTRAYNGFVSGPIIRNRWGYFIYGRHWDERENSVINATTLNPATLLPQSFAASVSAPARSTNLSIRTNYLAGQKHTLALEYSLARDRRLNQGLESGFDLPERAFNSESRNDALRFSMTSVASAGLVNELRLELARSQLSARALNDAPAIVVLNAFNAGGNQEMLFGSQTRNRLHLSDKASFNLKSHNFKLGFQVNASRLRDINRSDFGGTFWFGSDFERDANGFAVLAANEQPIVISALENYRRALIGTGVVETSGAQSARSNLPSQFSIILGDPLVGLSQWEMSWFAQDDWRVAPTLMLSYGLRHEFQTNLGDKANFAPRVGLAWKLDKEGKSAIRAGAGIFYSRLDSGITLDAMRFDGTRLRQFIIERPAFFPFVPSGLDNGIALEPSVHKVAPDLKAPYSISATMRYERELPGGLFGAIGYTWQRGVHLLRLRNVNAPTVPPDTARADSFAIMSSGPAPLFQFESTGLSVRHEMALSLNANIGRFILFGSYRLASMRSDTDGAFSSPANPYDLSADFSRALFDQRHQLSFGGSIALLWGFDLSPNILIASGRPFNITTGRDNNGDTLFTDRPSFASAGDAGAMATRFGLFNPNPRPGERFIPRNFGRGTGQASVGMYLSKTILLSKPEDASAGTDQSATARRRYYMTFSADVENLFNQTNFAGFNGVLGSPVFGRANRAMGARRVELGIRLGF